jgi:hypothetical protein
MKTFKMLLMVAMLLLIAVPAAAAADFDWLKDLNVQAVADPDGFRARLAARFKVGETQITTVLSNMKRPADAYMVFRMGEMSHHPVERVIDEYKANQGKGWGVMAKRLGIKPGSKEFHALKRSHDFDRDGDRDKKKPKGKDQKKDKVKDRDQDRDKGKDKDKGRDRDNDRGKGPGRS